MRKLIFSIPITIDGFIEGPQRELDWVIADDDLHNFYAAMLKKADLILYGRVTYELMYGYWPTATNDPTISEGEVNFANAINPLSKIVFSKTLKNAEWNTTVRDSMIPSEINKMKAATGGDILLGGGATLAQSFIQHGLVDEILLMVEPAVIGAGKALFRGINGGMKMKYLWNKEFKSGAVALCYQPDGKL
jgi:dihydrofolate reductase